MRTVVALIAVTLVAGVAPVAAQSESSQFRSGVEIVQLNVAVADSRGRLVPGPSADDFAVYEDAEPRPSRALQYVSRARESGHSRLDRRYKLRGRSAAGSVRTSRAPDRGSRRCTRPRSAASRWRPSVTNALRPSKGWRMSEADVLLDLPSRPR